MRKLTIIYHHAGGGHSSAAEALRDTLASQANPWDVALLDLQKLLDPLDLMRRATGLRIQDTYNLILRRGWTRLTPQLLPVLTGTIRLYHAPIVKTLQNYWRQHPADLVLSVIPHFNRAIADSLRANGARTPFVTLITDLADYPPHFWIEPESEFIIAGTERAQQQALDVGHHADHIFRTSGMILKPRFYQKAAVDRVVERQRLGLEPDCPTGIVLFGGHGSQVMLDIARDLNEGSSGVQLILICGHNQELAAHLRDMRTSKPMLVVGFTPDVDHYMALSDFFIGKPGPGSISEALQFHLPVIVECNSRTMPQERYNAQWLTENGFGIVLRTFREITQAVQHLLEGTANGQFSRVNEYFNRALFEVPEILERCVQHANAAATCSLSS